MPNAGSISHTQALQKAEEEYEKYRKLTVAELSLAEKDYFESIKVVQKKIEGGK